MATIGRMDPVALETFLLLGALALALAVRPWRQLHRDPERGPGGAMLALLAVLPFLWAIPAASHLPIALPLAGASLALLMLGWPLAVAVLVLAGLLAYLCTPLGWPQALGMTVWQGIVPATLALIAGALLRRFLGTHPVSYFVGRAYFGTMLSSFAGSLLYYGLHGYPEVLPAGSESLAAWLLAVGEAAVTGAVVAMLIGYKPQWLATWSDRLYLRERGASIPPLLAEK